MICACASYHLLPKTTCSPLRYLQRFRQFRAMFHRGSIRRKLSISTSWRCNEGTLSGTGLFVANTSCFSPRQLEQQGLHTMWTKCRSIAVLAAWETDPDKKTLDNPPGEVYPHRSDDHPSDKHQGPMQSVEACFIFTELENVRTSSVLEGKQGCHIYSQS